MEKGILRFIHSELLFFSLWIFCVANTFSAFGQSCEGTNCVWPGDANVNGIVNGIDFLYIGQAQGSAGPSRPEAAFDWTPQFAIDWEELHLESGINFKHSDCSGDGFVDGTDLYEIVNANFGFKNENFEELAGYEQYDGDDLYLTFSNDNPGPGDTITIDIFLGSLLNPVIDFYGIAFEIELDTTLIKEESITIDLHGGWLGTPFDDLAAITKYTPFEDDDIDFAFTRVDGSPVSGWGSIATFTATLEDVITGKTNFEVPLKFDFFNVLSLGLEEKDLKVGFRSSTIEIITTSIVEELPTNLLVYPNPAQNIINIEFANQELDKIRVFDFSGKQIFKDKILDWDSRYLLYVNDWPKGLYAIELEGKGRSIVRRFVVH